ncbi:MAG: AmmeMemoRadiSam system protein B [Candidatus Bathyarchaeota archaeon]|nr:MAG: AmmeMemoRadiSam system protein B [Candidatus Bathyarchaeota archaeon]
MAKIRRPRVAGSFYEGNAESLKAQIENCFLQELGPKKCPKVNKSASREVIGLVCPHAGYMFSGPVAANAYYELALNGKPDTVVILGPNHTGYGSALSLMNEGFWRTPLGDVEIDGETANQIAKETSLVDVDELAHRFEHSIEVQLPFLQYLYGSEFKFVPICFQMQDLSSAVEIGKALVEVLASKNAVVIASSDMTHYEPQRNAAAKDMAALKAVEAMDEKRFYSIIEARNVTACGYGPIAAVITAAKGLGAKEAKLLCYKSSGDITGDYSSVVGYATVSFKK